MLFRDGGMSQDLKFTLVSVARVKNDAPSLTRAIQLQQSAFVQLKGWSDWAQALSWQILLLWQGEDV